MKTLLKACIVQRNINELNANVSSVSLVASIKVRPVERVG